MTRLYINPQKIVEQIILQLLFFKEFFNEFFVCNMFACSTYANDTVDGNAWAEVVTVDRLYLVAMLCTQSGVGLVPVPNR